MGYVGGLFVDDKSIYHGPPVPYEKIKKAIEKKLGKLA